MALVRRLLVGKVVNFFHEFGHTACFSTSVNLCLMSSYLNRALSVMNCDAIVNCLRISMSFASWLISRRLFEADNEVGRWILKCLDLLRATKHKKNMLGRKRCLMHFRRYQYIFRVNFSLFTLSCIYLDCVFIIYSVSYNKIWVIQKIYSLC